MCGRYSLTSPLDELVETFDVAEVATRDWRPRFNVAPTQEAPVLVRGPQGLRLGALRWGLVPFWAEGPRVGARMINARSETVHTLPAFREAFAKRRCLVPADGFYEWRRLDAKGGEKPAKVPYWIHRPDRRPFVFAGLWERWRSPEGERLFTFTLLTTRANARLAPLHDRMPVVLEPDAAALWTDPAADSARLLALLEPAPDRAFEAWPVSSAVNAPTVDEPICVQALPDREHGWL